MWQTAASPLPPAPSALKREEVADGFQIAGFVSPCLWKLAFGKSILLVGVKQKTFHFTIVFAGTSAVG